MPKLFSLGILIVIILASCSQEEERNKQADQNVFFSLKNYFEAEANRLNEEQTGLDKTITINDKTEQHQVTEIDFHKELSLFSKADINKIAWADKYQVDTVFFDNESPKSIHYIAKEKELKTQELHLYFQANQNLDSLRIRSKSETALAGNENWLQFEAAKGYHIATVQERFSGDLTRIEVTSLFTADK